MNLKGGIAEINGGVCIIPIQGITCDWTICNLECERDMLLVLFFFSLLFFLDDYSCSGQLASYLEQFRNTLNLMAELSFMVPRGLELMAANTVTTVPDQLTKPNQTKL